MSRRTILSRFVRFGAVAGFLLTVSSASAQPDRYAEAQFATLSLAASFTPDPHVVEVQAGGSDRNAISGSGCAGYIDNARPTVVVNYAGGGRRLAIYVRSAEDTTLLVSDAGGRWHCSDDFQGSNPAVILNSPTAGQYRIWVGTYTPDASDIAATLYLSETPPRRR